MINGKEMVSGYIVHAYPDLKKNRLYFLGRLSDGRSFAAIEEKWRPCIHINENNRSLVMSLLGAFRFEKVPPLESFSGREKLLCIKFINYSDRSRAAVLLEDSRVLSPDADIKPAELFLIEKQIRGHVCINGFLQPGKRVDVVIREPELSPLQQTTAIPLRIASIDIETDVSSGVIRAVGTAWTNTSDNVAFGTCSAASGKVRVLSTGESSSDSVFFHDDEKSLLLSFMEDIRVIDPDVITGWNFLDFDFPHLAERFQYMSLPFILGRSAENSKFFPADESQNRRRRSAAAVVTGRQVLDGLRVMRAGIQGRAVGQGFTLDEIALQVLGEGKSVHETGDDKIAALDRLYAESPSGFGEYCLRDAQLILKILEKTGLFRLTLERASLTGVSLDKAWTSVVSFERIYGMELRKHGIAPPPPSDGSDVTGAAGGTVLEPEPGLFKNVAVFDFRSLYPTIMRTFNIDPLSNARAAGEPVSPAQRPEEKQIIAPNGAVFSRKPGLLPALIGEFFATRRTALESGDATAAQVYKILMNSFYGVLGTSACRYGRSELSGAITSFARKWLLFSRDWFNLKGFKVLYGDTDSLFVQTVLDDNVPLAEFEDHCTAMAKEINALISENIRGNYGLESFIELRFEKAYRRFMIPPLRNFHAAEGSSETRGRAKGYGGYLLTRDGSPSVEIVGMEAVRSDTTPLARRLQLELMELVFSGCAEDEFREKVGKTILELRSGSLDHELVYRKRLTRYPETYTSSTPPQVKAARALGWKKKRGTVEYLWTVNGPEPTALPHGKPDYDHYVDTQVFPLVRSIAAAAHWDAGFFVTRKGSADWQMELF